jgi:hypothetical protein
MPRSRASAGPVELFKNFAPGRMRPLMAGKRFWASVSDPSFATMRARIGTSVDIAPRILAVTTRAAVSTEADEQMIAVRTAH